MNQTQCKTVINPRIQEDQKYKNIYYKENRELQAGKQEREGRREEVKEKVKREERRKEKEQSLRTLSGLEL